MRRVRGQWLVLAGAFMLLCAMPGLVHPGWRVEAAIEPRGFTMSPAFSRVHIKRDDVQVQYQLEIRNRSLSDQNFRLSVVDFGSLDEEGGVAFLGQPTSELEHRYGLASWVNLEREAVFIPAGGSVQVKMSIVNRDSLASGGHYGAVLATAVTDTGQPAVDPRVGVKQVLSSLILADKEGDVQADLRLVSQSADGGWLKLPTKLVHRFQNAGNVDVVPRGVVSVKDPFGKEVIRGALNEGSGAVLPESFRILKTSLISVNKAWWPGRYAVVTSYRYDGTDKTKDFATSFWYAGTVLSWVVIVGALALAGLLAWGFGRRGWRPWRRLKRIRIPRRRHKT